MGIGMGVGMRYVWVGRYIEVCTPISVSVYVLR